MAQPIQSSLTKPTQKEPKSIFDIVFKVLGLFIFVAIVIGIAFLAYLFISAKENQKFYYETTNNVVTEKPKPVKALETSIPNFDNLALSDLFAQNDIRGVYKYNDKKIIIAYGKVLEYDPISNQLTRISNSKLNCAFSGAVAGDSLFIGCQGEGTEPSNSKIYEIDLVTGDIKNIQEGIDGLKLVNSRIFYDGKYLWIGSWDGALKINLATNIKKLYPPKEISPNCNPSNLNIFEEDLKIGAMCTEERDKVWMYDATTDSWVLDESKKYDLANYFNKKTSDYKLDIPRFFAFSKNINGKRFLLANDGVYTLNKGAFPQKLISIDLEIYSNANGVMMVNELDKVSSNQMYITKNEKYGVLFNIPRDFMDPADGTIVLLIDLENKTAENLLDAASSDQIHELVKMISDNDLQDALYWTDSATSLDAFYHSKRIMSIDLVNKKLDLILNIVPNL